MMDLKMEVYSPSLELLGLLEIQNSVIWERKAFSSGSFSLTSLITDESLSLLVPENIIWVAGEDAGIIEYVQEETGEDGPYITVKGCDLTGILERRILWGQYNLSGPVPELMYKLVDDCCINPTRGDVEGRKIPGLVLSDGPVGGASVRIQKTGGTLLEALEGLGEANQVPFGVRFNPAVPQMEFWARPGVNRSVNQTTNEPVFYSTELDDVLSSEYSYNAQDYRNVALVAGEGEGNARVYITVGGNSGNEPSPPAPPTPPTPTKYTVTVSVDPSGSGTVTGAGQYTEGEQVTVTATSADGYTFSRWTANGVEVGTGESYTFTVTGDVEVVASFEVASRLPKEYTELEYIITQGGTSILTDSIITTHTTRIVCDIEPIEKVTTYNAVIFAAYDGYVNKCDLALQNKASTMMWIAGLVSSSGSVANGTFTYNLAKDVRITIDMDTANKTIKMGTSKFNFSPVSGDDGSTKLRIGWNRNFNANTTAALKMKIYSAKVYVDGELKGDFVPCKNPSMEIGLYNLITSTFCINNSNVAPSEPIAGPEIDLTA